MKRSLGKLALWQAALWAVLGWAVGQVAGGLTASALRSHSGVPSADGSLEMSGAVVVPALLASQASLLAIALLAPRIAGLSLRTALNLRPASPACFVAAAAGTVMLTPTADVLMRAMEQWLPQLNLGLVAMLHELVREVPILLAVPAFALLPGLAEELMFRGMLQTAAGQGRLGITISAVSFALIHVDPHHVAGVLPLGFFLAWVASRCGTWVTIFAHAVNNAASILAVHSAAFDVGYGTEEPMPWQWLPVSMALVAICVWIVLRNSTPGTGMIPVSEAEEL